MWVQKKTAVLFIIATFSPFFTLHSQSSRFIEEWEFIKASHQRALNEINIVGNGVLFLKDSAIVAESMYGYQDNEKGTTISINTIYNWASCTKVFTAIAIMQLRDQKKLSLNDLAKKYVPELEVTSDDFGRDLTIEDLLTHTSGLPRFSTTTRLIDGNFYETQSKDEYKMGLKNVKLKSYPGEIYSYSNLGYDILGLIIENVSGRRYEEYVTERILKPLGMNASYFRELPPAFKQYRSNNYRGHKGKLYSKAHDFDNLCNTGIDFPSGGLNAPFSDMQLFISFICRRDSLFNKVLKVSTLEEMLSVKRMVHDFEKNRTGHRHFVGLGFNIINPEGYRLIGHEGESSGFMTAFWVKPDNGSAYLFAWNTTFRLPNKKDERLFRSFNKTVVEKLLPMLE